MTIYASCIAASGAEDRYSQHRWGADQSFQLEKKEPGDSPIKAYLDIEQIVRVATVIRGITR